VTRQYQLYHEDSEAGKALKAKCDERGIKLPEDFGTLQILYSLRGIRGTHSEQGPGAKPVPISLNKTLALYEAENGPLTAEPEVKAEEKPDEKPPAAAPEKTLSDVEVKKRAAAAVAAGTGNELPVGEGGGDLDLTGWSTDKFTALMRKPVGQLTQYEVQIIKTVYRKDSLDNLAQDHLGDRYNE